MIIVILFHIDIKDVPFIAVDYCDSFPISLMHVPSFMVDWLITACLDMINREEDHAVEEVFRQLTLTSLLKSLSVLTEQMTSISITNTTLLEQLMRMASRATKTPGVSVIPEMVHIVTTSLLLSFQQFIPCYRSQLDSSSSSESVVPTFIERWEVCSDDGEWKELSVKDSQLITTIIRGEMDNCFIRIENDDKYLMSIPAMKLISVHSSQEYSFRPSVNSCSPIRESLLLMGFSPSSIELSLQEKGESIQECIQYLLEQSTEHVPVMKDSISDESSEVSLPSLKESDQVLSDCCNDKDYYSHTRKYFGEEDYLSLLDIHNLKYLWNVPYRKEFLIMQSYRRDSGKTQAEVFSSILHAIKNMQSILSRVFVTSLFYKSTSIPFTPDLQTILKITALQSIESYESFKAFIKETLRIKNGVVLNKLVTECTEHALLICKNQYSESTKRIGSLVFNTDTEICEVAQLRFLLLMTTVVTEDVWEWNSVIKEYYQWITTLWCRVAQVPNPVLQQIALDSLMQLASLNIPEDVLKWTLKQVHPLVNQNQLQSQLHAEIHNYPVLTKPLQSLFTLSSFVTTHSTLSPSPKQFRMYHFHSHGYISLSNQAIQPSWTLEFWFRLVTTSTIPIILFNSMNQSIQLDMNQHQLVFMTEGQSISFPLSIPLDNWIHFALTVDGITNVPQSYLSYL